MSTGPTARVRELVYDRDCNTCVRCGRYVGNGGCTIQHRIKRGMGGSTDPRVNAPSALLTCCLMCNTIAIEGDIYGAYEWGWAVRRSDSRSTTEIPVMHAVHGRVLLDNYGGWAGCPVKEEEIDAPF